MGGKLKKRKRKRKGYFYVERSGEEKSQEDSEDVCLKRSSKNRKAKEERKGTQRWTNVATGAGRPSKGSLQARYQAEVLQLGASSRLPDGILPPDLPGDLPSSRPPPPRSSPALSGAQRVGGSASTLRLWIEKSPRVKHDLQQGREKSIPPERFGERGWLLEGNVWQRVGEFCLGLFPPNPQPDSHFFTRICHHQPRLSPPLRRPPRGVRLLLQTSGGLGLPWVRSSTCFSALVLRCRGFRTALGVAGSRLWLGPFHTARLSLTQLLARVKRAAQGVVHRKGSVQPEQTLLVLNAHRERASRAGLTSSRFRPRNSADSPCRPKRGAGHPSCAGQAAPARWSLDTGRSGRLSWSWLARSGPMSAPRTGPMSAPRTNERAPRRARLPPARPDWSRGRLGRAGQQRLREAASARREWEWRASPTALSLPAAFPPFPPSLAPSLPPRTPRLRPRAGGAPHCTLRGRRSVRGMEQRAAAGGRNPRAARVSRGGLRGRAQKETGLLPAARAYAGPGPTTE